MSMKIGFGARQIEIEEAQLEASGWDQETIDRKVIAEHGPTRSPELFLYILVIFLMLCSIDFFQQLLLLLTLSLIIPIIYVSCIGRH